MPAYISFILWGCSPLCIISYHKHFTQPRLSAVGSGLVPSVCSPQIYEMIAFCVTDFHLTLIYKIFKKVLSFQIFRKKHVYNKYKYYITYGNELRMCFVSLTCCWVKDLKLCYLIRVFKKFHGMTSFRSHVWPGEMAQQGVCQ